MKYFMCKTSLQECQLKLSKLDAEIWELTLGFKLAHLEI